VYFFLKTSKFLTPISFFRKLPNGTAANEAQTVYKRNEWQRFIVKGKQSSTSPIILRGAVVHLILKSY
jgi:hypothetical protein